MVVLVYMVGGMSSRFGGIKQLCRVGPNNETLLEISLKQALKQRFSKVVFVTNKITEHLFKEVFQNNYLGIPIDYIEQVYDNTKRSRPWGTTDALCTIKGKVNEPFILLNSDDIYGEEAFKEGYNRLINGVNNILGLSVLRDTIKGDGLINRGIVEIDENTNEVKSLKETLKIDPSKDVYLLDKKCNINFICLQVDVIDKLNKYLINFKEDNVNDNKIEALLPDDLNHLIVTDTIKLNYFTIKNKIISLTYPSDVNIVKEYLK